MWFRCSCLDGVWVLVFSVVWLCLMRGRVVLMLFMCVSMVVLNRFNGVMILFGRCWLLVVRWVWLVWMVVRVLFVLIWK